VFVESHASCHVAVAAHLVLAGQIDVSGRRSSGNISESVAAVLGVLLAGRRWPTAASARCLAARRPTAPNRHSRLMRAFLKTGTAMGGSAARGRFALVCGPTMSRAVAAVCQFT
jgi:hypothetical protein